MLLQNLVNSDVMQLEFHIIIDYVTRLAEGQVHQITRAISHIQLVSLMLTSASIHLKLREIIKTE